MLLLLFYENPTIWKHLRHAIISRKTLIKYNHQFTSVVEKQISDALPEKFSIISDGWSANDTHYVAVIASYQSPCNQSHETVLLRCSPMENEASLNEDEHYDYLSFELPVYGKDMKKSVQ